MRRCLPWMALCGSGVVLIGLLFAIAALVHRFGVTNEISLPLLAIVGVVALIGVLALVAIGFSLMSMSDKTQALGLPSGSVRAVIALSLVVLFGILTVFLFSSLNSGGRVQSQACMTGQERDAYLRALRSGEILLIQESLLSATGDQCPESAGPRPLYAIYYRVAPNPAGEDFAKQLLVLIGTLVTSVAGFYFGAKSVADAQDSSGSAAPPSLLGVEPGRVQSGGDRVRLRIMGSNLNQVTQAQIASGDTQIADSNVVSNPGQAEARFTIPAGAPTGLWDIVVIDSAGRSAKLAGALTVENPPTQRPAGPTGESTDPTGLAKQGAAIRMIAAGMKSQLDAMTAKTPFDTLHDEVTKLGDAGQALQPRLSAAKQAIDAMAAAAGAGATDADRADAAAKDAVAGDQAKLKASADRLGQLHAEAMQASHDFDRASAAYDQASRDILARAASG